MPLNELPDLINGLLRNPADLSLARLRAGLPFDAFGHAGTMYCPNCFEYSGMKLEKLYFNKTVGQEIIAELCREDSIGPGVRAKLPEYTNPALVRLSCVNCQNIFYGLIYKTEKAPALVIVSVRGGGIATPNTSALVAYYLEQAYKAQAATAFSAALAMYRAALDQILEDKGYDGSLPAKLTKLADEQKNNTMPPWAKRLNSEILTVLKDICNRHVHPSELAVLQALDAEFMSKIQRIFSGLLSAAYEQETRQTAAKAKLNDTLAKAKNRTQGTGSTSN
ncbi:MAG: hypothetical protein K2Y39_13680 [Candidatus Obscuribacterales bacterium]|nr:hypothetical protein [Candidatus Obscuribacterales bacterium]